MTDASKHKAVEKHQTFLSNFFISSVSGGLSKTISAPIERVKLLLQNQHILENLESKYKGNLDCVIRIYREQGFLAYWRGNMSNVVRYVPNFALNYSLKEFFKKQFTKPVTKAQKIFHNILSASLAGGLSIVVTYPLDFARTRMGVDVRKRGAEKEYKSIFDCIYRNFKKEGIRGIYAGFLITFFGSIIYRGLMFGLHDSKNATGSFMIDYFTSCITTGIAGIFTLPFDTVRRRMMIETGKSNKKYTSYIKSIKVIYSQEGFVGFSKGGTANFIRSFASAFTLVFNDYSVLIYQKLKL